MDNRQRTEVMRKFAQLYKPNSRTDNNLPLSSVPRRGSVIQQPQESSILKQANYNKRVSHPEPVSTRKIYGFKNGKS